MPVKLFMIKTGQLEPISKPIFTTGDSYLVVDQAVKKIYIWLGSKCSVDEKGVAAVEARRIDDGAVFNGAAKIITYDEGDEANVVPKPVEPSFLELKVTIADEMIKKCSFCERKCEKNREEGELGVCKVGKEAVLNSA